MDRVIINERQSEFHICLALVTSCVSWKSHSASHNNHVTEEAHLMRWETYRLCSVSGYIFPILSLPPQREAISDPVLNFGVKFNMRPSFSHSLRPLLWAQRSHQQLPCSSSGVWVPGLQVASSKFNSLVSPMQRPEVHIHRIPSLNFQFWLAQHFPFFHLALGVLLVPCNC